MSIEKLQANHDVSFQWVHFPLHPDTPPEGLALTELFAGRDIRPMQERMKGLMREAGLAYGERTHTYNSRLAQELGKWADAQAGGEKIHNALFQAYFADARNISDTEVLLEIAGECGLDTDAARKALEERLFEEPVNQDWARSREAGITGVPTFVNRDLMVVGCQPYEVLERFVKHLQTL